MKKAARKILPVLLFLYLTACMLWFPEQSLYFALTGLKLWFEQMIPALLPFMILSNLLIGLNLADSFVFFLKPFLGRMFRLNGSGIYAMFVGFLCGFPMGAKVVSDLYLRGALSKEDASFLLSFCNNIGPIYFTGFVLVTLKVEHPLPYVFGMYGLPFLYGLTLRHIPSQPAIIRKKRTALSSCDMGPAALKAQKTADKLPLLDLLDDAIMSALYAIAKLGGYMIFFNLLNLIPFTLSRYLPSLNGGLSSAASGNPELLFGGVNCLLEITSGISRLQDSCPALVLILLPFGGFSCIAQTYSMIKGTGLSIRSYTFHKIILTAVTALYYLLMVR